MLAVTYACKHACAYMHVCHVSGASGGRGEHDNAIPVAEKVDAKLLYIGGEYLCACDRMNRLLLATHLATTAHDAHGIRN